MVSCVLIISKPLLEQGHIYSYHPKSTLAEQSLIKLNQLQMTKLNIFMAGVQSVKPVIKPVFCWVAFITFFGNKYTFLYFNVLLFICMYFTVMWCFTGKNTLTVEINNLTVFNGCCTELYFIYRFHNGSNIIYSSCWQNTVTYSSTFLSLSIHQSA